MEVGEGCGHHGGHHAPFPALLLAVVTGAQVTIVGQAKDVALVVWGEHLLTNSCARMNAELRPSSLLRLQERSGSQAPDTGA